MIWKPIVNKKFSTTEFRAYLKTIARPSFPQFVVVHNTQDPTLAQWQRDGGVKRIAGLVEYYRDELKWSGGPHLFVEDTGIWVFTPLTTPGVHSPSWNGVSWGVEIVGDYDKEVLSDDVKANALDALAALHEWAGWADVRLKLHKDDPKTEHTYCPGKAIDRAEFEQGIRTFLEVRP